jgi:hypothetical protein
MESREIHEVPKTKASPVIAGSSSIEKTRERMKRFSRATELTPHLDQLSNRHKEINPDQPDSRPQKLWKKLNSEYRPKTARVKAANEQIQADGAAIVQLSDIEPEHLNKLKDLVDEARVHTESARTSRDDEGQKIPHKTRLKAVKRLENIRNIFHQWKQYLVDGEELPPLEISPYQCDKQGDKVFRSVKQGLTPEMAKRT